MITTSLTLLWFQCKSSFVGALGSVPFPNSGSAAQHLLLFISALIPKALASLLTSFTLALGGPEQVCKDRHLIQKRNASILLARKTKKKQRFL